MKDHYRERRGARLERALVAALLLVALAAGTGSALVLGPAPLTIASTLPENGAVGVPWDATITGTWNRPVSTTAPPVVTLMTETWVQLPCTVTCGSDSFTITPLSPLRKNMRFYVSVSGATDPAGIAQTPDPYEWSFTTVDNLAPVAVLEASPTRGMAPLTVAFDASGSLDPDGSTVYLSMDYGDGGGSQTMDSHTYTVPGTYYARLVVHDGWGSSATATTAITVISPVDATAELRERVVSLGLPSPVKKGLTGKLDAAVSAMSKDNRRAAVNSLNSFALKVQAQRGRSLTDAQADELIAVARAIVRGI